jgi:outer membrane receptor protein involved in Fe transport
VADEQPLKSQTAMQYEAGLTHQFLDMQASLSYYYYDISDYIATWSTSIEYARGYSYNVDSVKIGGIEFSLSRSITARLNGFASYAYQSYEIEDSLAGTADWYYFDLNPKHTFNLGLRYKALENTLIAMDLRYKSSRGTRGGEDMPSYTITNLSVEQSLFEKKVKAIFYVNNIFDKEYEETYGYPMPGTNFGCRFKFSF